MAEVELIPCPTCWLRADVTPPGPSEDLPHARCSRGHDNALAPPVLEHLRDIAERRLNPSAG